MATECPDCGKFFKTLKCSCGYTPSSPENKEAAERKWREIRRALDAAASVASERDKARLAVLASVKNMGRLRWAHQVIALHDAGIYGCDAGLRIAKEALRAEV